MPYSLSLPFFAFRLQFISGGSYFVPMQDVDSIRINQSLGKLAKEYSQGFQKNILDGGDYSKVLEELNAGTYIKDVLKIKFPASRDEFSYPEFELEFDFFLKETAKGNWGIIPSLGLESFSDTESDLEDALIETVKQHFKREKRFSAVQGIIAAIWWDTTELLRDDLNLKIHTLPELQKVEETQKDLWLPKVATELDVPYQVTYGRKKEIDQITRILKNDFDRNVILIGPAGVGKTALVWEFAHQQFKHKIRGKIWETTASVLIKELTADTGWQDNIAVLIKELTTSGDILFVRNLLELFEVGKYIGNEVSMADYMLTYLSRGEFTMITECTEEEKAMIELRSPTFLSYFQKVQLAEPKQDLEKIILKKVNDLAGQLKVKVDDEAIKETIRLNKRFTPYSGFPGKPIRFLEGILLNQPSDNPTPNLLTRSEVIQSFCEETGMPILMVDPAIPMQPKAVKADFNQSIFGQSKAIDGVVNMLSAVKTGLTKTGKPIASFLFVGPTGVGKTELAKVLSKFMFGSREKMIRFDMSEYSGADAVSKLLGSGYYSDGLLTSTVRREPFCVLLFDEIEKANASFYDLLLQILGEGRLTDSSGKLVNFCSTIIIMTSNIGASKVQQRSIMPNRKNQNQEIAQRFLKAVQDHFKPEMYNRIDEVIAFEPLTQDVMQYVVKREIHELKKREGIKYRRMELNIEDPVLDYLSKEGYDKRYGARQLQRTIQNQLIIPLSKELNLFSSDDQLVVDVSLKKKNINIEIESDPLGFDLILEEMEKSNYADISGEYRRRLQRFKNGYFFTQFMSDLDILEREKEQKKEKFWKDKSSSEKYSTALNFNTRLDLLNKEINQLEIDFSLAYMDLAMYKSDWGDVLDKWKKEFFQYKVDLYISQTLGAEMCGLRIYGFELKKMMDFYLTIFDEMNFEYSANVLWYRESHYNKEVEKNIDSETKGFSPRKEYIQSAWLPENKKNFLPKRAGDELIGIEFFVKGNCPYLFLENESGIQRWKISDKKDHICVVDVVQNINQPHKEGMYRKDHYPKKNVFRTLEPFALEDKKNNIKRETKKGEKVKLILEKLNQQFKINLNVAVG